MAQYYPSPTATTTTNLDRDNDGFADVAKGGLGADFSADVGYPHIDGGAFTVIKSNLTATAVPTVTDDSNSGYTIGSRWIYGNAEYLCTDASVGFAVWIELTGAGTGNMAKAIYDNNDDGNIDLDAGGTGGDFSTAIGLLYFNNGTVSVQEIGLNPGKLFLLEDDGAGNPRLPSLDASQLINVPGGGAGGGEANSGQNIGTGEGVFAQKSGTALQFKTLIAGTGVTLTSDSNSITIDSTATGGGETNTASNLGAGEGIFSAKSGVDLQFKSLIAGSGISFSSDTNTITVNSTASGGGETNTASNLGAGEGIFSAKSGADLQFKSLVAGTNVSLSATGSELTINSSAEINTASNLGAGEGVFGVKSGVDLRFKSLVAGTGITLSSTTDELTIGFNGTVGETNTASNLGGGEGIFGVKSGADLRFKSLVAGTGITLSATTDELTIGFNGAVGETNTASNLGAGEGIFGTKSGADLRFKSLVADTGITLSSTTDELTIGFNGTVGETNTASNLGAGEGIFGTKSGADLQFKSLVAGNGVTLSSTTDSITIDSEGKTILTAPSLVTFSNDTEIALQIADASLIVDPILTACAIAHQLEDNITEIGGQFAIASGVADSIVISGTNAPTFITNVERFAGNKKLVGEAYNFVPGTSEFTAIAWVKPNSLTANSKVFNAYDDIVDAGWFIRYTNSTTSWDCGFGNGAGFFSLSSAVSPVVGTWVMLVITFDNTQRGRISVDGGNTFNSANFASFGLISGVVPFTIGAVAATGGNEQYLDGEIAQVLFYNRVLSDAEIQQIYNSGAGRAITKLDTVASGSSPSGSNGIASVLGAGAIKTLSNSDEIVIHFDETVAETIDPILTGLTLSHKLEDAKSEMGDDFTVAAGASNLVSITGTNAPNMVSQVESFPSNKTLITTDTYNFVPGTSEFTIIVWVKLASLSQTMAIFSLYASSSGFGLYYRQSAGNYTFRVGNGSGFNFQNITAAAPVINEWMMLAVTFNSSQVARSSINANGYTSTSFAGSAVASDNPWAIGSNPGGNSEFLDGDVAQVLFFERVISDTEIQEIYNSGAGRHLSKTDTVAGSGSGGGETNTASNLGSGEGIFSSKSGADLRFKSLIAGTGITLSSTTNTITIDSTSSGGEANTASNLGAGEGIFRTKAGVDLRFKSLVAGSNISLSSNNNEITINSTASGGGETNTASNLGAGEGIFGSKSGVDLQFKSLVAGTGVSLSSTINEVTINSTGEINTASNLGAGEGVFSSKSGADLRLKSLVAGTGITLSSTADELTINSTATGGGETNTASNLGTGEGTVFAQKLGVDLQFKSLKAGSGVIITNNTNDITIDATGAGGGEANTAANLGAGEGLFAQKNGVSLEFKSIVAGSNISLSSTGNEITINSTASGGGETNTASNLGAGEGIFGSKSGADLRFKSLIAGTDISLASTTDTITIGFNGTVGETNTASNLGAGEGVFSSKSGADLRLKSLVAGSNISLSSTGNEITINSTASGGGETNTASNLGTGEGTVFAQKSGVDLQFKSLKAGSGVTLTNNTNDITIDATGGGGGESNTASNLGAGEGIFSSKSGVDLQFKTLVGGNGITLASSGTEITINSEATAASPLLTNLEQAYNAEDDGAATIGDNLNKGGNPTVTGISGTNTPTAFADMIVFDGVGDRYSTSILTNKATFAESEDFSAIAWVRVDTLTGSDQGIFSVYKSGNRNWALAVDDTGVFKGQLGNGSSSGTNLNNNSVSIVANTWYMIAIQYDSAADTMRVSVNAGNALTFTLTGFTIGVPASPELELGSRDGGGTLLNGAIAAAYLWSRRLSDAEITELYNSGVGVKLSGSLSKVKTVASATNVLIDAATSDDFKITLNTNVTFDLSNISDGQLITLYLLQDGTGGRTAAFSSNFSGTSALGGTTANAVNVLQFKGLGGKAYTTVQGNY